MAVIVKIDGEGNSLFESVKGLDIPEEDRKSAIELDKLVKKDISRLVKRLKNFKLITDKNTKSKVETYWEFGSVLRKIFFGSGLVNPSEKKLFWRNVILHSPEELLAKDRGPNRIHVEYCFRLAGYPKKLALKREWSEWVYLFDSPFINSEERFDKWDQNKIENEEDYTTRENTRLFIQCLNSILKDVETEDLNDDELVKCYEGAWSLSKKLTKNFDIREPNKFKISLKNAIYNQSNSTGQLMDGKITAEDFAKRVIREI